MSLLNSQYTYFELSQADDRAIRKEVDRLTKEADDVLHVGPPAKRSRLSQSPSQDNNNLNLSLPEWGGVSGTVMKVTLEDFLCHKYLIVDFNPKINFIVGRNGSGKSAILAALVVALGGNAVTTGRGSSLKDFIRTGTTSARVTCVINNSGNIQYKPHEYGPQIIIVRNILQTGGSVVLKSARGKKVASTMDELRNMTLTLGIQVDNPISVLDQNTARIFLNASSPQKKFELFMKATNLESIQRLYARITRDTRMTEQELASKKRLLEENSREVEDARKKYEIFQNLEKDREKAEILKHEYLWATHHDDKHAVDDVMSKILNIQEEKERLSQMLSGGGAEESILQEIEHKEKEIEEYDAQESDRDNQSRNLKQEAQGISMQYRQLQQEKSRIVHSLKEEEDNVVAYKNEIEAQQQRMMPDHIEQRRLQKDRCQALQRQLDNIKAEQSEKDTKLKSLHDSLEGVSQNVKIHQINQRTFNDQLQRAKRDLTGLQAHSSNLAVFGAYIPELLQKIDQAAQRNRFQKKPVGPLGMYVKVKDAKWTLAIEAAIGGALRTFAVDNTRDERELQNIMKSVIRNGAFPSTVCTKFQNQVYNTSRTSAQSDQYSTVLNMIEISNPIAANLLIEQSSIETTLLIPSDDECFQTLSDQRRVPRNCRQAYTLKGDVYYPAPGFKTYSASLKSARVLQTSREDILRSTQTKIAELETSIQTEQQSLQVSKKMESDLRTQIHELTTATRQLQSRSMEIAEALENLKDQQQPDLNTVQTLRKDLEEKEEVITNMKETLQDYVGKLQECQEKVNEINTHLRKVAKDIDSIRRGRKPLREKVNELKQRIREIRSTQASTERNLEKLKKQEMETSKEKEKVEAKCVSSKEDAEKYEAFLAEQYFEKGVVFESLSNTKRSSSRVEQELKSLQKKLAGVEKVLGDSVQNISTDFQDKVQVFNNHKKHIETLVNNVNYLKQALQVRKKLYHTQRELMCAVVSHQFTRVLRYRSHVGSLKFDLEVCSLTIESGPMDGTDRAGLGTSSLSGGERSYTTMAFVIALWNVTELPFYFMDEFDVFMDVLNRKTVLTLMLRFAKQKRLYQFGFLTPLDTTEIKADDDVTIFKLDDPRG